ncbi:hypothetical protein [Methylobacterium indicum]|uniref:hypothetical protein n=1 Tax=Methylobacterium indicum TaxID=1775910 RepID=UPI000A8FF355|nr:hypothetical protein [Methylobacterium indicum]
MPTKDVSGQFEEIQHDPLSPAPSEIGDLPIEEIIEQVRAWFYENFEDPGLHTPYETAEGGFQYIWGGPYDTIDIIQNIFADELDDDQVGQVVSAIERDGIEWVPSLRRQQPPEDDDRNSIIGSTEELHTKMLSAVTLAESRLDEVELYEWDASAHGIGHNRPPEPIDDSPATKKDIEELRAVLAALKVQPITPDALQQAVAKEAHDKVQSAAFKIAAWIGGHANTFIGEALKEAGKETGKRVAQLAIWGSLATALKSVAEAALQWLGSLNLPF